VGVYLAEPKKDNFTSADVGEVGSRKWGREEKHKERAKPCYE
jgi:hypothetical protein